MACLPLLVFGDVKDVPETANAIASGNGFVAAQSGLTAPEKVQHHEISATISNR
jgi:hypothetical protein